MKRIIRYSNKRVVKNITDIINNSKIFTTNIPILKLHNKVSNKEYNNSPMSKVYLTVDDIKEHSINPKRVEYRLKLEEQQKKSYYRKCSEYKTNIELTDKLDLSGTYKEIAEKINKYFVDKINNSKINGLECECKYNKIERMKNGDGCLWAENGNFKYLIMLGLHTKEYKDTYVIDYYGNLFPMINIFIIKPNKTYHNNYLEIYLQNKFIINVYLYI